MSCALVLTRYRRHSGSLTRAAFLSARNDAQANVAIIAARLLTAYTSSALPDLIVGLGIAAKNADATRFSRRRHHPTGVMSTASMAGLRARGRRCVRRKSVLKRYMNKGFTRGSA